MEGTEGTGTHGSARRRGGTHPIGVPLRRRPSERAQRGGRRQRAAPRCPWGEAPPGCAATPCPVRLGQPGVSLLPQFPLAEAGIPLPAPRADGCLGSPLTPRARGHWLWAPLALMPTEVVQPGEKRDHSGAELAAPPRRVRIWPLHDSNVTPSVAVPCRWSRASRTPLAPCSQRGTKRGPWGGFSLPDVRSPPGTPQAVSRRAEVSGRRSPAGAGAGDSSLPYLWWHGSPCLYQPGWRCCSCWPPAPLAEHLLGGPKSPWVAKIPPRWPKSPWIFPVGKIRSFCPLRKQPAEEKSRAAPADAMGLAETWKENPAGRGAPAS